MNELEQMNKEVKRYSLCTGLFIACVCAFVWPSKLLEVAGGVMIGLMCALMGYQMISHMATQIHDEQSAKSKAYFNYLLRYAFYGIVLGISIYQGINVFAILAGFLSHKASLILYGVRYREEMD